MLTSRAWTCWGDKKGKFRAKRVQGGTSGIKTINILKIIRDASSIQIQDPLYTILSVLALTIRLIFSLCRPSFLKVALIRHLYSPLPPASDPVDSSRAFAPSAAAAFAAAAAVGLPLAPFAAAAFPFAGGELALGRGVGAVLPSSERGPAE